MATAKYRSAAALLAAVVIGALFGCGAREAAAPDRRGAPSVAPAATPSTQTATFRLVMLGDSLTAGFGLNPADALPVKLEAALRAKGLAVTVVNAGVSGDTMADAAARLDWALDQPADGLLVALGGNDMLRGVDPDVTEKALGAILARGKEKGLLLIVAGMKAPGNYGADWQARFDALFERQAKAGGAAFYPFLLDGVAGRTDLNQADRVHANPAGVAVIVDRLSPVVADAIRTAPTR